MSGWGKGCKVSDSGEMCRVAGMGRRGGRPQQPQQWGHSGLECCGGQLVSAMLCVSLPCQPMLQRAEVKQRSAGSLRSQSSPGTPAACLPASWLWPSDCPLAHLS